MTFQKTEIIRSLGPQADEKCGKKEVVDVGVGMKRASKYIADQAGCLLQRLVWLRGPSLVLSCGLLFFSLLPCLLGDFLLNKLGRTYIKKLFGDFFLIC